LTALPYPSIVWAHDVKENREHAGSPLRRNGTNIMLASLVIRLTRCLVAVVSLAQPVLAQVAPAASSPATQPDLAALPELAGVPDVKAGMTPTEMAAAATRALDGGRVDDAEKILTVLAKHGPPSAGVLDSLATVYERQAHLRKRAGDAPAAQQYVAWAVETSRKAAELATSAAELDRAERLYTRLLALQPGDPKAQLGLARVLATSERVLQAIERYKTYLNLPGRPETQRDPQAWLELGRLYRRVPLLNLAISSLVKARALDANNPDILMELAATCQDNNQLRDALDAARSAVQKAPTNAGCRNMLVTVVLAQVRPRLTDLRARLQNTPAGSLEHDQARQAIQREAKSLEDAGVLLHAGEAVKFGRMGVLIAPDDRRPLESLSQYYSTYREVLSTLAGLNEADVANRLELARATARQGVIARLLAFHQALAALPVTGVQAPGDAAAELRARLRSDMQESLAQFFVDTENKDELRMMCARILEDHPDSVIVQRVRELLGAQTRPAAAPAGG